MKITLSELERNALLDSIAIDDDIMKKIQICRASGNKYILNVTEEESEALLDGMAAEINHETDENRMQLLDDLYDRIDDMLS